jgi:TPR repeat protein
MMPISCSSRDTSSKGSEDDHSCRGCRRGLAQSHVRPGRDQARLVHDEEAAHRWFRPAGARGDVGWMLEVGTCATRDSDLGMAKFWLGCAAVAGSDNAILNLGSLLLTQDPESAPVVGAGRRQGP